MKKPASIILILCMLLSLSSFASAVETPDLSGTATAYTFQNCIDMVELTTDRDGVVTSITLDQGLPPFSWARVRLTEEEMANPPEDTLVGGISLVSATREVMAFSKYICINGQIFVGSMREEGDPWLTYNSEQTVKYSSVDGKIEDLNDWLTASEENMAYYYQQCVDRTMYICEEDGTPSARETGAEYLMIEGLGHDGEPSFLKSTTDLSFESKYFNWNHNLQAFYDAVLGTKMETQVTDLTQQKGEDGKMYWTGIDAVTSATNVTYPIMYATAAAAYQKIMTNALNNAE